MSRPKRSRNPRPLGRGGCQGFNIVDVDKKQILAIFKEFLTKYDDFDTFCYLINGQVTFVQRKSKIIKYVLFE